MKNKDFKEELSGLSAMFLGVVVVLALSCIGNLAALGEFMYWLLAAAIFFVVTIVSGIVSYVTLSIYERCHPSDFTKMKRTFIVKSNRLVENWFGGEE